MLTSENVLGTYTAHGRDSKPVRPSPACLSLKEPDLEMGQPHTDTQLCVLGVPLQPLLRSLLEGFCGLEHCSRSLHVSPPVCGCLHCLSLHCFSTFLSAPQALWPIAKCTPSHKCFQLNASRSDSSSLPFSPLPFLNLTTPSLLSASGLSWWHRHPPNLQASGTPPTFTPCNPISLQVWLPRPTPSPSCLSCPWFWFL